MAADPTPPAGGPADAVATAGGRPLAADPVRRRGRPGRRRRRPGPAAAPHPRPRPERLRHARRPGPRHAGRRARRLPRPGRRGAVRLRGRPGRAPRVAGRRRPRGPVAQGPALPRRRPRPGPVEQTRASTALADVLGFLSEDAYRFDFVRDPAPRPLQGYLKFADGPFAGVEEVALFSGGLDSLGGAVRAAAVEHAPGGPGPPPVDGQARPAAAATRGRVGRRPNVQAGPRAGADQQVRRPEPGFEPAGPVVPVRGDGRGRRRRPRPGRRPVLRERRGEPQPADLGRRWSGPGRRGPPTRAVLAGFAGLFSRLAGRPFAVDNPFLWDTKADVVRGIVAAGRGGLIRDSVSCAHTRTTTAARPHCGLCSQCVDRRFAVLAAGAEADDPACGYAVDLVEGGRPEGEGRSVLASYVETASRVARSDAAAFLAEYGGEASRALRYLGGGADAAALRVYDLCRRHAREVTGVVDRVIADRPDAIRLRTWPDGSLVRLLTDGGPASPAGPAAGGGPCRPERLPTQGPGVGGALPRTAGLHPAAEPRRGLPARPALLPGDGVRCGAPPRLSGRGRRGPAAGGRRRSPGPGRDGGLRGEIPRLREELAAVRAAGDAAGEERVRGEMEALHAEIERARGPGGRVRRAASWPGEVSRRSATPSGTSWPTCGGSTRSWRPTWPTRASGSAPGRGTTRGTGRPGRRDAHHAKRGAATPDVRAFLA